MGTPLTIQPEDNERLETFKANLGVKTKIDVLRAALDLLEEKFNREKRMARWAKAAKLVAKSSARVNKDFRKNSLLRKA